MLAMMNQALPSVLFGMALFVPLVMATWFAPALILFGGARPATALGVSLKAVARNWLARLTTSIARGLLLFIAALVPLLLGLLVAMPVLFGLLFASYQAIFAVWADDTAPVQAGDSMALANASHFVPASRNFTCTRASAPRPSKSMMMPVPNLAWATLCPTL